jgi:hypothetical protein
VRSWGKLRPTSCCSISDEVAPQAGEDSWPIVLENVLTAEHAEGRSRQTKVSLVTPLFECVADGEPMGRARVETGMRTGEHCASIGENMPGEERPEEQAGDGPIPAPRITQSLSIRYSRSCRLHP